MYKIVDHPLIKHKLSILRDKNTLHPTFKTTLEEITSLMIYDVLKDLSLQEYKIETPIKKTTGFKIKDDIIIVPILRAGLGMVSGIQSLVPQSRVGHIGIYRDEKNFKTHEYFYKMPNTNKDAIILLVDPMLATGTSADLAIKKLKSNGFKNINLVSIVAVDEGINLIQTHHPNVRIFLSSKDVKLNSEKYIEPGLGDAGDRLFGTK